jgi:methionine aminopeptidase
MAQIIYKSKQQLENLKESGKYLTELLYLLFEKLQPGVIGIELEDFAQKYIDSHNLK